MCVRVRRGKARASLLHADIPLCWALTARSRFNRAMVLETGLHRRLTGGGGRREVNAAGPRSRYGLSPEKSMPCGEMAEFGLFRNRISRKSFPLWLLMFGWLVVLIPPNYSFGCTLCGYEKLIGKREKKTYEELGRLLSARDEGEIDEATYAERCGGLTTPFLEEIREHAQQWICRECGESNAPTFASCW